MYYDNQYEKKKKKKKRFNLRNNITKINAWTKAIIMNWNDH